MTGRLALAMVRSRLGSFVAAFLALMCAASLVTACGVLMETGLRGSVATERYAGSPLVLTADQSLHFTKSNGKVKAKPLTEHAWMSAAVLERLRGVRGGEGAVGELTFAAAVETPDGTVIGGPGGSASWGHAWSSAVLTPFTLAAGHAPTGPDDVVVDARLAATAHLHVGSHPNVQTAAGTRTYRVTGITHQSLADQASMFFSSGTARALASHPGQVFAVGLPNSTTADAGRISAALSGTGVHVESGSDRGLVEFTDAAKAKVTLVSVSGVLGATALLVAVVVVSGTFALSIGQRRRELALLRAVAATPRQIRRMIGREAVLVGILAAVPGCALGVLAASWLRSRFVAFGVMPPDLHLRLSPLPMVAAVLVTVVGGWVAARISARRTARIHPSEALAEAAVEPPALGVPRLVAGVVAGVGYVVLLGVLSHLHTEAASSPVSLLCAVLAVISVALLGPLLARISSLVLSVPMGLLSRRVGFLAAANNRTNARRLASVMTPITLAVAVTSVIVFTPTTVQHAAAEQRSAGILADSVVVPTSGDGLPGDVLSAVAHAPGVSVATPELRSVVRIGQDKYPSSAFGLDGLTSTVDPGVTSGSLAALHPIDVALSTLAADHRDLHVGDRVIVTLGDGTRATLTLAAIYSRGLGFGDVMLPYGLAVRHVDSPLAQDILVRTSAPGALSTALHGVRDSRVVSVGDYQAAVASAETTATNVGYIAMALIIAFAAVAILNTLAMATIARTRELATLRLTGLKRRQVSRMIQLETLAAAATAIALGAVLATGVLTAYADGMTPGYRPHAPLLACGAILAGTLVLVVIATVLPTRHALRANPADAINEPG